MARAVTCSIDKGVLRIGWSYTKTVAKPAASKVNGVDTGIADLFYLSDGKHFGSMREVLDFYHKEVENLLESSLPYETRSAKFAISCGSIKST